MILEKIPAKRMAYMSANHLVDPYTASQWLKTVSARRWKIFFKEHGKLVREREEARSAFIYKQATKSWLDKLLGL